jgi:hypothetical protein
MEGEGWWCVLAPPCVYRCVRFNILCCSCPCCCHTPFQHTQAAICPAFVSRPEGRKFLSCLLTVHPSMVQEMTSVIRNQVGGGKVCVWWRGGVGWSGAHGAGDDVSHTQPGGWVF